jgi:hypothetical protein
MATPVAVYLPASPLRSPLGYIEPGSGIVGKPAGTDRVHLYYEGNRYRASGMARYADRVHHAAGRMLHNAPTSARTLAPAAALVEIGLYDWREGQVHLLDDPAVYEQLAAWLGLDPAATAGGALAAELQTAGSSRHTQRREIRAALAANPDPARRRLIADYAHRYGHDDLVAS